MGIAPLPTGWDDIRSTLQAYAQALTAVPRAGAGEHDRWSHVAMEPIDTGWVAAPTPLSDGSELVSVMDLEGHRMTLRAADDVITFAMVDAPDPSDVARSALELAGAHGSTFELDWDRIPSLDPPAYAPALVDAFQRSAGAAVSAMNALNERLRGEVTGPHLWPHGFDIATEWYSERLVEFDGSQASAQISLGWYPTEDGYLYSTPWPFDDTFAAETLPAGARWNLDGWQGARWDITGEIDGAMVTELGRRVHEIAGPKLRR